MKHDSSLLTNERSYECNVVEHDEFNKTIVSTLADLLEVLADHCGPYKGTAILMDPNNNPLAEPVFTKDGINIIDSIRYKDPVRDFVRKQLAYMGKRIDRGAGDGTTSSMFLMANTIEYLLLHKKELSKYTTFDISDAWNELVKLIEDQYKSYIDYAKNMKDRKLIRYVAESQAYTSSHGDIELAKCIGDLFANTPREVWNNLVAQRAMFESDKKYNVTINTAEYTLDNVMMFPKAGNEDLGTVLHLDDVDCLIWYHVTIGDTYQKPIFKLFEERAESGEPLVVMCCNDIDVATQSYLIDLFEKHPEHKGCITFITVPFSDPMVNDLTALDRLLITAGKTRSIDQKMGEEEHPYDIVKLTIECKSDKCRILKGIFNKKTLGINPFYKKKEYKEFNEYLNKIQTVIDNEKSDISRRNTKHIEAFTRVLYKLISTKDVVFTIGGSAYDNAAGRDIVMDALLATKCSLTQGFVAGRCVTLKHTLEQLIPFVSIENVSGTASSRKYILVKLFIDALLNSISELNNEMDIPEEIRNTDSPADIIRLNDPSYETPKTLDTALQKKKDYCIIQPAMTDITFLKRFGELGLKFLTATSVIPVGSQWQ